MDAMTKLVACVFVVSLAATAAADPLPKCRAVNAEKKVFAEAEGDKPASCFEQLYDKVQESLCVAGTKGKKFEYTVQFDHVIKAGKTTLKMDDEKKTHTCRVIGKLK